MHRAETDDESQLAHVSFWRRRQSEQRAKMDEGNARSDTWFTRGRARRIIFTTHAFVRQGRKVREGLQAISSAAGQSSPQPDSDRGQTMEQRAAPGV